MHAGAGLLMVGLAGHAGWQRCGTWFGS